MSLSPGRLDDGESDKASILVMAQNEKNLVYFFFFFVLYMYILHISINKNTL